MRRPRPSQRSLMIVAIIMIVIAIGPVAFLFGVELGR